MISPQSHVLLSSCHQCSVSSAMMIKCEEDDGLLAVQTSSTYYYLVPRAHVSDLSILHASTEDYFK